MELIKKLKSHRPVRHNTMEGRFVDKLMKYSEQKHLLQKAEFYNLLICGEFDNPL